MSRWTGLFAVPLLFAATLAAAQAPLRPTDPVFVRAQTLVSDGNGVAGRALIDSVIAATQPTARLYPEALFWRATLAANAADAESDYKHIVVDYPLAPQAEDALLRLAQLELARGDRDGALGHLQRIPRDYPRSKSLARASYWMARVLFEKNDIPNACAANANALAQADASQVELRNQIQYQGQRCPVAVATVNSPMTDASANNPKTPATASTTPKSAPPNTTSTTPVTPTPVVATEKEKPRAVDTTTPPVATPSTVPRTVVPTQRPKPPTEANDSKPSIVDPAKAPKAAAEKAVTKASTTPSRGNGYSVQVAAYTNRAEADKLTSTLRKRGYATRVDGSVAPFRVRVGRYATEKEAEDALRKIKANHMDGFVVRAPER
ncbi:MAG TPA: SPOR domain-containing protein [Gemmatimonadaceae bacterium]|nr:SPOR domain-containing protein [Gemmatimonadaceae bacterium]HMH84951.1 SPOR domain-containing protein [Gemmatimonadaceae bacterium]